MRQKLICKSCGIEIFVDVNMVMVHDELWVEICGTKYKLTDALCDTCIEEILGRHITPDDFKDNTNHLGTPLCNKYWMVHQKELLSTYSNGWNDHNAGVTMHDYEQDYLKKAYNIGKEDSANDAVEPPMGNNEIRQLLKRIR